MWYPRCNPREQSRHVSTRASPVDPWVTSPRPPWVTTPHQKGVVEADPRANLTRCAPDGFDSERKLCQGRGVKGASSSASSRCSPWHASY